MNIEQTYEDKDPKDWNDQDIQEFLEDEEDMRAELTEQLENAQVAENN